MISKPCLSLPIKLLYDYIRTEIILEIKGMREDIVATKREKLIQLTEAFGTAYPETAVRTHTSREVLDQFESLTSTEKKVSVVGRVRSLRVMGKIAFCHLEDGTGKIQGFFSLETLITLYPSFTR